MTLERYSLIVIATLLITFNLPTSSTASPIAASGGTRVITLSEGKDIANSVAFSPDGKWLAVGTSSGISIYDSQTLTQERFISTAVWARSVTFSPDGGTLAAGLFDGSARFWRFSTGEEIRTFVGHGGWVRCVAFSADGSLLATAADDDIIRLWNTSDGTLKLSIPGLTGVRVLALSSDGQTIAVGLQDSTIQLRAISDGSLQTTLTGHKDWVRSLAFSPDGQTLASGAFDAKAILWDVSSGQMKYLLPKHHSSVLGVSFSPDGNTLATGSVDSTVKLWNVTDGSLQRTLVGHSDFVYSVTYAPDGKTIASGSSDNTVRLWDLSDPEAGNLPEPTTPSDCRLCHHPRGTNVPPRVLQVNCEVCHGNGIGMNWCPFFPRSPKAVSDTTYFPPTDPVGVPISSENLAVRVSYPTNGETLYVTYKHLSPVFVTGNVYHPGDKTQVNVRLQIYSNDQLTEELTTQPNQDGTFSFRVVVNSQGASIVAGAKAADPDCASCHEDFKSQGAFPNGKLHFIVTATAPDGELALDERWLTVDTSHYTTLDVRVVDLQTGLPFVGVPVHAETILYEWRGWYADQPTNIDGLANISLEVLSQALTHYEITVPRSSVNGYFYEGVEPVLLDIQPDATNLQPVTIYATVRQGQIKGNMRGAALDQAFTIWAIHLPDGSAYQTSVYEGKFAFEQLPSGNYQVFVDPAVRQLGYTAQPLQVDLTKQPQAIISLTLKETSGRSLSGRVTDVNGSHLSFGWIATASNRTSQLAPADGSFQLFGLPADNLTLIVDAPGYYSQARIIDSAQTSKVDFALVRRPDTRFRPWGTGNIILPAETIYEENQGTLTLQNGWAWGQNSNDSELRLRAARTDIVIERGSFALKYLPGQGGWWYQFEGEAFLQMADQPQVRVRSGEMIALLDGENPIPVPYDPTVVASFQLEEESPLLNKWEPTFEAQVRDRLAQIGVNIAQVVTFVTYVLVLIVMAAFIIGGIYSIWKQSKRLSH